MTKDNVIKLNTSFNNYRKFYTVTEMCTLLRLGKTKAYHLLRTKKIPSYKVEGKILIDIEDINSYLQTCKCS